MFYVLSQQGLMNTPMESSVALISGTFELDMFSIIYLLLVAILVSRYLCLLEISRRLKCAGVWLSRLIKTQEPGHHCIFKTVGFKTEIEKQLAVDAQKDRGLLLVADIKTKEERGFVEAKTKE